MHSIGVEEEGALAAAAAALQAGEVIVVPTDTVYGLAALPDDAGAARRIYLAKNRPTQLHLPVLAASVDQVRRLGVDVSQAAASLAARWWPGPLTMVFGFSATSARPSWLRGREEVAVRIPQNTFLLALLRITGVLLVTSANRHGLGTPASADEAASQLSPHVGLIVKAGTLDAAPSTLVNVRSEVAVVEREGSITREAIAATLAHTA
ncbi:MAG: L-threonylcarbamoyladenylate synthase [Acidimicrobiales bacterium]